MSHSPTLETLLREHRSFPPPREFAAGAVAKDPDIYDHANADPFGFWAEWARTLDWFDPYDEVCSWKHGDGSFKDAKWFVGGKLNACHNCLDRQLENGRSAKTALIWEGEPADVRTFTYAELHTEVSRLANALRELGIGKGDLVSVYMPMVPELAMTLLACARIGAPHSVVFGGFSAESLAERTNDASAKLIVTADGGWRRGAIIPLKKTVDEALDLGCPTVEHVLVLTRTGQEVDMMPGRDIRWEDVVPRQPGDCDCERMDSEDLLYVLYTSGSTGKPKGIVHTTGGYMTGVTATTKLVFDLKEDDVYFCTADIGWVTGHSYTVYGPLSNGATVVMYEGAPDTPDKDRFWRIVEKHRITILYTAPTAIRSFMKWGDEYPARCDLTSLRLLGTVGEPINPEAWIWYHLNIGGARCPIVDTWWQTETGAIMITPLPGLTTTKPGSATKPFPGIAAGLVEESGAPLTRGAAKEVGGILVLKRPWPSLTRGIFNDPERFERTYFSRFPGCYFPGDGAKIDSDGDYWLLGRVDDVMLVAGHNISTMEVESALVDHPSVAEAAVIGKSHPIKGQGIAAFVIIRSSHAAGPEHVDTLKAHVAHKIGAIARPDDLFICAELPKTRSGKIMRRLLRDIAEGRALGDTTTLADASVMHALRDKYESAES